MSLLDKTELNRFNDYLRDDKKTEFLAGRCLIKQELGDLHDKAPNSISLSITENGKPYCKEEGDSPIHFNLSHGNGYFILALSKNPIGVDLEKKRTISFGAMAPILSDSETRQLAAFPEEDRSAQILNLFTAKEAFIKATDKRYGLDKINFSLIDGEWKLVSPDCDNVIEHINHAEFVIAVSVDLE